MGHRKATDISAGETKTSEFGFDRNAPSATTRPAESGYSRKVRDSNRKWDAGDRPAPQAAPKIHPGYQATHLVTPCYKGALGVSVLGNMINLPEPKTMYPLAEAECFLAAHIEKGRVYLARFFKVGEGDAPDDWLSIQIKAQKGSEYETLRSLEIEDVVRYMQNWASDAARLTSSSGRIVKATGFSGTRVVDENTLRPEDTISLHDVPLETKPDLKRSGLNKNPSFITPCFSGAAFIRHIQNKVYFPKPPEHTSRNCLIAADFINNRWQITRIFESATRNGTRNWIEQPVNTPQNFTATDVVKSLSTWSYVAGLTPRAEAQVIKTIRPDARLVKQDMFIVEDTLALTS